MLKDHKKYEKKVMKVFYEEMKKNQQRFFKNNIFIAAPELNIIKLKKKLYTSEVSVYVYLNKEILGVIDFFIFYDGKPEATLSEFKEWFQNELEYFFQKANTDESGKVLFSRLIDEKYRKRRYKTGMGSEFDKIRKWGDLAFE